MRLARGDQSTSKRILIFPATISFPRLLITLIAFFVPFDTRRAGETAGAQYRLIETGENAVQTCIIDSPPRVHAAYINLSSLAACRVLLRYIMNHS